MAAHAPEMEVYPTRYSDVTQLAVPSTICETMHALGTTT